MVIKYITISKVLPSISANSRNSFSQYISAAEPKSKVNIFDIPKIHKNSKITD